MEWSTFTDVRDEATPPTRIPMITRPVSVQMMAKIRAGIERGDRSPYLSTENKIALSPSITTTAATSKANCQNKSSFKGAHVTNLNSYSGD